MEQIGVLWKLLNFVLNHVFKNSHTKKINTLFVVLGHSWQCLGVTSTFVNLSYTQQCLRGFEKRQEASGLQSIHSAL